MFNFFLSFFVQFQQGNNWLLHFCDRRRGDEIEMELLRIKIQSFSLGPTSRKRKNLQTAASQKSKTKRGVQAPRRKK